MLGLLPSENGPRRQESLAQESSPAPRIGPLVEQLNGGCVNASREQGLYFLICTLHSAADTLQASLHEVNMRMNCSLPRCSCCLMCAEMYVGEEQS